MERELFWISVLATIIFLSLSIFEFAFLGLGLSTTLIALLSHEMIHTRDINPYKESIEKSVRRIEQILISLRYYLSNLVSTQDLTQRKVNLFERNLIEIEDDFHNRLDKMARKVLEIESNMKNIRKDLSASVSSLDERLVILE